MPFPFTFDPDVRRAQTIPSRLYTDPVYLELERERIFARTWQLVARSEQLAETGDFLTASIGDESIVIVRDGDTLRGFHNICLHRAGPVADGCGRRKTLQCRYHGWTYTLRGELLRAPEMDGTERFSPDGMRLLPVQVAVWGPLVFANLDPKALPLEHYLDGIPERAERFGPASLRWVGSRSWDIECNWKVYVDNYLEGYHVPMVHPGLHKELDYDAYRVETRRYWSLQHAPLREAAHGGAGRRYVPRDGDTGAEYYWLFPNVMLNVYLGQMQTNVVLPLDHRRTRVVFDWYTERARDEVLADPAWTSLVAFSDEIQAEDVAICEVVQRNLRSRVYDRGRYSAKRENGVHHFHGLLHEFLS
jgi:choline monooxygenase